MRSSYLIWLGLGIILLGTGACKGPGGDVTRAPSLTVSVLPDQPFAYPAGLELRFQIHMQTDPAVGIGRFGIRKNGEQLFDKSDYIEAEVDFEFTYTTELADAQEDTLVFTFSLTDLDSQSASDEIKLRVVVDYPFQVDELVLNPSWDLVKNEALADSAGNGVDIYQFFVNDNGCTATYWTSSTGTVFFDLSGSSLSFADPNLSLQEILNAVSSRNSQDTLLVAQTGFCNVIEFRRPLIAQLRGKEVYVLIDYSNPQVTAIGYRKTSASAGE